MRDDNLGKTLAFLHRFLFYSVETVTSLRRLISVSFSVCLYAMSVAANILSCASVLCLSMVTVTLWTFSYLYYGVL
jgi:hypothetical protein